MTINDIVLCYYKVLFPKCTPSKKGVREIVKEGKQLLRKGWTISNITNRIVTIDMKDLPKHNLVEHSLFQKTPPLQRKGNILEDKFYYHHYLHRTPNTSTLEIDIDGTIKKDVEPYYLEITEYFSIDMLMGYFNEKLDILDKNIHNRNKSIIVKYLDSYKLDHLLFTIDVLTRDMQEKGWKSKRAENLLHFLDKGREKMKHVKNNSSGKIKPFYKAYLKRKGAN